MWFIETTVKGEALFLIFQELQISAGVEVIIDTLFSSLSFLFLTRVLYGLDKQNISHLENTESGGTGSQHKGRQIIILDIL